MFGEGDLALLLEQPVRLHPVVEVHLHFLQPNFHAFLIIDGFEAELFLHLLFVVYFRFDNFFTVITDALGLCIKCYLVF